MSQAFAAIRSSLDVIAQARLWARPDEAARDGVRDGFAALGSMQACWLRLIADLDSRPDAVSGARAGLVAQTFLRGRLLRSASAAGADLRAVRALAPDADPAVGGLPCLGAAFAAGLVSREHVDVAVKAVRRVPKLVLSAPVPADVAAALGANAPSDDTDTRNDDTGTRNDDTPAGVMTCGQAVDVFLTAQAQLHDPQQLAYLVRHLLSALDPDHEDGFDPDATERRQVTHSTDANGMLVGSFALGAVDGAWFSTAMDHFSAPNPTRTEYTDDGAPLVIRDQRTPAQRRADALGLIARLALGADAAGTAKGGEAPRIVIHTGLDELHTTLSTTGTGHTNEKDPEPEDTLTSEPGSAQEVEPELELEPEPRRGPELEPEPRPEAGTGTQHAHEYPQKAGNCAAEGCPDTEDQTEDQTGHHARDTSPRHPAHQGRPVHPSARGARWGRNPIGRRLLSRYACDAVLAAALLSTDGAILDLGRDTRTITRAQRRALAARDRGCVMPGCTSPAQWCEGHHVTYWRHGGPTDIGNLALVCGRCHDLIHQGIWQLIMINGTPWARPPAWIDPLQRLIRNTLHTSTDQAHTLGAQMRLVC